MRRMMYCFLLLCLLLGLTACGKKDEEPENENPNPPEDVQPSETPEDTDPKPEDQEEIVLHNCGGLTIALPKKYESQLVFDDGKAADETSIPLMRVFEKASLEAAEADFGDSAGFGFLFEISEIGTDDLETWQELGLPGSRIFARDDHHYYIYTEPTDVQLYRRGGGDSIFQEEDLAAWEALSDLGPQAMEDMITRNGLTPFAG